MNLFAEIRKALYDEGKSLHDVSWVGSPDFKVPVDKFLKKADVDYDNGYGAPYVPMDLLIVLEDGSWLERHEYDGLEWFEYKSTPPEPELTIDENFDVASKGGYCDFKDLIKR